MKTALASMTIGDILTIGSVGYNWGEFLNTGCFTYLFSNGNDGMIFGGGGKLAGAINAIVTTFTYKNETITVEYIVDNTITRYTIDLNNTIGAFDRLCWIEYK